MTQTEPIRHAVEGIRHEDVVRRLCEEIRELIGIAGNQRDIANMAFGKSMSRNFEQLRVDIDGVHVVGDSRELKGEPTIAGA